MDGGRQHLDAELIKGFACPDMRTGKIVIYLFISTLPATARMALPEKCLSHREIVISAGM